MKLSRATSPQPGRPRAQAAYCAVPGGECVCPEEGGRPAHLGRGAPGGGGSPAPLQVMRRGRHGPQAGEPVAPDGPRARPFACVRVGGRVRAGVSVGGRARAAFWASASCPSMVQSRAAGKGARPERRSRRPPAFLKPPSAGASWAVCLTDRRTLSARFPLP